MNEGFLWRKYVTGCPVSMVEGPVLLRGLSSKLYPKLMRWDQLQPAFCGFVSLAPDWLPAATCYDLQASMRIFYDQVLGRTGSFVVDAAETVEAEFPHVEVIRLGENYGAVARNAAMSRATAEYLVTLDDDVWLDDSATLRRVVDAFRAAPDAGAITFRVREAETGRELNGCVHPSRAAGGEPIETATFAGGAVAFRTGVLADVGLYPPDYFISIEEDDLAVRMMDVGRRVVYRPDISVTHSFSERGRASWRRHYFDLRNSVWFAARHYPVRDAVRFSARRTLRLGWLAMRDGYPLWPLKALHDAVAGLPSIARTRRVLGPDALARIRTLKGGRL